MKELRILVLKNAGVNVSLTDDFQAWKNYEEARLGVSLVLEVRDVDIEPLGHKVFITQPNGKDLYGLDNIKNQVRALNIVQEYVYAAVMFVYDVSKTQFYKENPSLVQQICNWCYFDPYSPGTSFIEVVVKADWPSLDPFRVFSHEFRHGCVGRLRRLGHEMSDVMDSTPVKVACDTQNPDPNGGCSKDFPYYKEFEPLANDGNRAMQNVILTPFVDVLVSNPEKQWRLAWLQEQLAILLAKLKELTMGTDTKRTIRWAEGIKKHEGWYVGSRSYRNNNPGNFRYPQGSTYIKSLGAIGRDKDGFAIFKNQDAGWNALLQFLRDAKANKLISYRAYAKKMARPGSICTISDFFHVYAPSSDDNNPIAYAKAVVSHIGDGVTVGTPVNQL